MKVGALIVRKGDDWSCLGCGSDLAAYAKEQADIITAQGKVGKGKDVIKYDEIVLIDSTGIRKRRKL